MASSVPTSPVASLTPVRCIRALAVASTTSRGVHQVADSGAHGSPPASSFPAPGTATGPSSGSVDAVVPVAPVAPDAPVDPARVARVAPVALSAAASLPPSSRSDFVVRLLPLMAPSALAIDNLQDPGLERGRLLSSLWCSWYPFFFPLCACPPFPPIPECCGFERSKPSNVPRGHRHRPLDCHH